jgi:hypothetical protein
MIDVEEVAVRSGTTAEWAAATAPKLALGEVGIDNTTGEARLGDGASAWAALRSIAPKRSTVTLVAGAVTVADTSIKATSVVVPVVKTLGTVAAPKEQRVAYNAGVSYVITSADATDTSTLAVLIFY